MCADCEGLEVLFLESNDDAALRKLVICSVKLNAVHCYTDEVCECRVGLECNCAAVGGIPDVLLTLNDCGCDFRENLCSCFAAVYAGEQDFARGACCGCCCYYALVPLVTVVYGDCQALCVACLVCGCDCDCLVGGLYRESTVCEFYLNAVNGNSQEVIV